MTQREKRWSKEVIKRDDGICKWCGNEGCDPAHIFGKGAFPRLKFILENGICLCRKHHTLFDTCTKFRNHILKVLIKKTLYDNLLEVNKDDKKRNYYNYKEIN